MSQKRKRVESTGGDYDAQISLKKPRSGPQKGSQKSKPNRRPNAEPKANSTNAIKGRIRDLKRLLEHVDNEQKYKMPAGIRIERERELETLKHELEEKTAAGREAAFKNKMISKYHQVRFFDRRKADRVLKRLRRELSALEDRSKKAGLLAKIHNAEVDLNYAMYHPLLEPYSSLYPNSKRDKRRSEEPTDGDDEGSLPNGHENGARGNHEMWKAIEEAMEAGTLGKLRNRKPKAAAFTNDGKKTKEEPKKDGQKSRPAVPKLSKDIKDAASRDEEDESDGGFFE